MSDQASTAGGTQLRFGEPAGRWVLAATVLGSTVAFLDATVVNIALPAIGSDLSADASGLTWTVNAYALALAALVLVGGSLGDQFGRRRLFMLGVAWFGLASLACALSTGIEMLVVSRALQGIGAALLAPGALAILQATFRPEDRSRAIGAWSGLAGTAGAVGPFLGGWLVEQGSWRWIFLINVPVVLIVLAITARHVPESRDDTVNGGHDLSGAVLGALALGAVTYALSAWSERGVAALTLPLSVGLVALIAFVVRERSASTPMLPLSIFAAPRFAATNAVTFLVYAGLGGVFFWLVLTLQVVAGWSPLIAGLSLLPVTVIMLLFSPQAGMLGDRFGPRLPLTLGPLLGAVGVALLARLGPDAAYFTDVLLPVSLLGAGLTITVTPLTSTALGAVEGDRAGLAGGINNAVARTGGLVVVASLPAVSGLAEGGFADPTALQPAFHTAMLICAALLASAGAVAAVAFAAPTARRRPGRGVKGLIRHCAVDATPLSVGERASR